MVLLPLRVTAIQGRHQAVMPSHNKNIDIGRSHGEDDAEFGFAAHHARIAVGGFC